MSGVELIAAERERQVSEEGWTEKHDDEHTGGALGDAAACYATSKKLIFFEKQGYDQPVEYKELWPWGGKWDKREKHDPKKRLIIAGALCAAELDRLLRLEKTSE